ncbi:MAG TPA: HYExAFE family protein [Tepidisphaeraceae bacterium]|nr:HYExAFE family protein [Tepidisphaeraceae bacterium]
MIENCLLDMASRMIHYEAAFEAYLRDHGIPYVAVDEAKKALFSNAKLKSFDFVVYSKNGRNLLVDVKGRQLRGKKSNGSYQTWATEQDVADLLQWQQVFGEGFTAVLMFAYWIDPPLTADAGMFQFKDRWYLLMGVGLVEYQEHMRRRSVKWETVALPQADFRSLARPIESWL